MAQTLTLVKSSRKCTKSVQIMNGGKKYKRSCQTLTHLRCTKDILKRDRAVMFSLQCVVLFSQDCANQNYVIGLKKLSQYSCSE